MRRRAEKARLAVAVAERSGELKRLEAEAKRAQEAGAERARERRYGKKAASGDVSRTQVDPPKTREVVQVLAERAGVSDFTMKKALREYRTEPETFRAKVARISSGAPKPTVPAPPVALTANAIVRGDRTSEEGINQDRGCYDARPGGAGAVGHRRKDPATYCLGREIMSKREIRMSLVVGLSLLACSASAQETADTTTKDAPATKLESFSSRKGIVVIKGFTQIGELSAEHGGRVWIDAREFRDASSPRLAQYGIAIRVKEAGRLERENTSFVDEDEIDSLIRGIEYVAKIKPGVTAMGHFEATYRTKGDLAVTVFSKSDGGLAAAIASGRIGRVAGYLDMNDIEKLHGFLVEAKSIIARSRAALAQK